MLAVNQKDKWYGNTRGNNDIKKRRGYLKGKDYESKECMTHVHWKGTKSVR